MSKEKVETKKFNVRIKINGNSSCIFRTGMPFIEDETNNSICWLKANGYKPEEIEIIGEKPECWNSVFPPAEPTLVEKIESILS